MIKGRYTLIVLNIFMYVIFPFTPQNDFWDTVWYLNNYSMLYALSMGFSHKYIRRCIKWLSVHLAIYTILVYFYGNSINSMYSVITLVIALVTILVLGSRNNIIKSGFFKD